MTPDNIRLIFYIPEEHFSQIKLGHEVTFECDGCQTAQKARITYISPQAEYTPPVIYSRESRAKLVYRIEANLPVKSAMNYHPGQPVQVNY